MLYAALQLTPGFETLPLPGLKILPTKTQQKTLPLPAETIAYIADRQKRIRVSEARGSAPRQRCWRLRNYLKHRPENQQRKALFVCILNK